MIKKITFIVCLICVFNSNAQEPVSIQLSEKDGLPDKEFYNIIEDDKGFVWLCADKGFFRYDGKHFVNYSNQQQRGLSVFGVKQDASGKIWCNNISGQFFYVKDNRLELFIDLSEELKGELAEFEILDSNLLVFSRSFILTVDIKNKKYIKKTENKNKLGSPFKIDDTFFVEDNNIILNLESNFNLAPLFEIGGSLLNKSSKYKRGKSRFFKVGTSVFFNQNLNDKNVFFQLDLDAKVAKPIYELNNISNERIYDYFENNNEIWIATNSGVWIYKLIHGKLNFVKRIFSSLNVSKIIKDSADNYWFTTLNNGVHVVPNIAIEISDVSIKDANITALDKVNDSVVAYGTTKGNVGFYNVVTNKNTRITLPTKDRVSAIKFYHSYNKLLIGKDINGYVLDYDSGKIEKIGQFQTVKSICILENNTLLYTDYYRVGLIKEGKFNNRPIFISRNKRTYASHYNLKTKETLIAYVDELKVFDTLWKSKTIRYKDKPIFVKTISQTSDGTIWVGTFKDGIYGIKDNKVSYHFSTSNGLTSNNIQKIKGNTDELWIASDNSIQLLSAKTKTFKTLTKREGVLSYDITGIEVFNNKVYFSSSNGLFSIISANSFKNQNPEVYFNAFKINDTDTSLTDKYKLDYDKNTIEIGFNVNGFLFNHKGTYQYRLKGLNDSWFMTTTGVNFVKYNGLPAGNYTFEVKPFLENFKNNSAIKSLNFSIKNPFWKTWWFLLGIIVCSISLITYYLRKKIKTKEKEREAQLEKISLEKELLTINLMALRSQMNPHFIFNSLNSIQDLVLKEDTETSYDYIVLFANLIRNTLTYSNQDFITVDQELEFLEVYLRLEKLRFGDSFNYTISYKGEKDLYIPSMMIQPFLENALVHGLLHKEGQKKLNVSFEYKEDYLHCVIIDNGVGRKRAEAIRKRQGNHHESFALSAINKRLTILNKRFDQNIGYVIEDLNDEHGGAIGTKVILTMPNKKSL
ncbi:sensor histidine kinase [Aquimarina rubra]|uniref:Sensor histidine kinase n=1 Tax=Aquimarina rubra TaxID=1920033 RepID=A0ABW5LCZ3_9FLAO